MISVDNVTWLMPILNGMPYLPQALESIRSQSCGLARLLVWDNGSTDGTLEVLKEWIPRKIPGHVYQDRPLSLGLSLRALVEEAKTPYCARMDADDVSLPTRLERQLEHLEAHPEMAANATDFYRINEKGEPALGFPWMPHKYSDILHGLLYYCSYSHPSILFRRDKVLQVGNYKDESTSDAPYWPEDYDLWQRLFSRFEGELLKDRLLLYRHQPNSLSHNEMRMKRNREGRARVFAANAAEFCGINCEHAARRLYLREVRFALPKLIEISLHLSKFDKVSAIRRWQMPSFLKAASKLTSQRDILTRLWIFSIRKSCNISS